MGKQQKNKSSSSSSSSLRSKAVHFVSDLTTIFLNPISDHPFTEDDSKDRRRQLESITEEDTDTNNLANGPDTSSFSAFLYSLLANSEQKSKLSSESEQDDETDEDSPGNVMKENVVKKGLFSRGKQSIKAIYRAARGGGRKSQEHKSDSDMVSTEGSDDAFDELEMNHIQDERKPDALVGLPDISEPSMLLTEKMRSSLYASLPALVQGRKWLLLYSTWRHGISLSTLYRKSTLWPGLSLLVVGDRKGAVFGSLIEAPLRPTNKKRYQGTNSTFVFTNVSGQPVIFRPTGANRYFTCCSHDFLAIGGGGHFALYLDSDLLTGSSSVSETYGNPCLAFSEDFDVKEVELWGFVYGAKYDEILESSRTEAPGICRW